MIFLYNVSCSNPIFRIPNRRDRNYFDEYENPSYEQTPFYQTQLIRLHQCLYVLSGPNFLVPFIGKCSTKDRLHIRLSHWF